MSRRAGSSPTKRGRPPGLPLDRERLRRLRSEQGLTQRQLAHRAAVSLRTVEAAESGARLSPATISALETALACSLRLDEPSGQGGENC